MHYEERKGGVKKVVLAYSGGLDTSCCVAWLKEKGFDVITYTADLGQGINFAQLSKKAKASGVNKVYIQDLKDKFLKNFVLPALKANAIYEGKYPLATALGRPLIAEGLVEIAHKEKAKYIAHGCTGKGNDQVRIEVSVAALDKKLKTVAPLREWKLKTRTAEIKYAKKCKIKVEATKKSPYSTDLNLWGRSIECGLLEDPAKQPPEEIYQLTKNPLKCPNKPTFVTIEFIKGTPVKLNGKRGQALFSMVAKLNKLAGDCGVGRIDMVENRLVGIKSREIYEAPAAVVLHLAHQELENLVLDKETLQFKKIIAEKYAQLVYNGLWHSPLKAALDKFVEQTQKKVSGAVKLKLYKGSCICVGRKSPHSLYKKELATYEKGDKFDKSAAEGFIKIWGLPYQK
ncbi:MAG: argininosuccinate synthase [Candidatus Omnitrophica bacterium]|nr:argininosuccinate synthase [Candidatus Omnitrophota bacterium]